MQKSSIILRRLRRILLFVLPVFIFFAGGEWALRSMPNAYKTKASAMEQQAPHIRTLCLGASHILMGVNPDSLSLPSYNLAGVSQTLDLDFALLQTYLPRLKSLETVVVGVDPAIVFDPPLAQGDEAFRATYYDLYMPLKVQDRCSCLDFEMLNYIGVRNKISALINGDTDPHINKSGWYSGNLPSLRREEDMSIQTAKERADYHARYGTTYLESNRTQLRNIYNLCHQHKVRLLILLTPTGKAYRDALPQWVGKAQAETLAEYRNLQNVRVLDYSADDRFSDDDFFDADHLNTNGAAKFSAILRNEAHL